MRELKNDFILLFLKWDYTWIFLIKKFNFVYGIIENPGWIGETLCLIALSVHGLTKSSILNILRRRGYTNNFEVNFFAPFLMQNLSYFFFIFTK